MRRHDIIPYILYMLFAVCSVSAYGQFNPDNPEEPQAPVFRYRITTSCSTQNVAWTSGDGEWVPGDQVWIHTSSYNGQYTFSHWAWTVDGKEYTNNSEGFYFTMKEQAVSFVAHYRFTPQSPEDPSTVLKSHLYLSSEPEGKASFNRTSGERLEVGCSHYVEAYPNQGYEFRGWFVGNTRVSEDQAFYYTMPDGDVHLVARYVYRPINPPDPDDEGGLEYPEDELQGDVNGDDEVDTKDLRYLVKIVLGQQDEIDAADVNRDVRVTISDITNLIQILRKKAEEAK